MFCPKCGKEINDDAAVCVHCGRSLQQRPEENPEFQESKSGLGVVLGLFLGLIGLIIGLCLYPAGTIARKTFLKAWGITFSVCIGVAITIYVILIVTVLSTVPYYI